MKNTWKYILTFCVTTLIFTTILIEKRPTWRSQSSTFLKEPKITTYHDTHNVTSNHGIHIAPQNVKGSAQNIVLESNRNSEQYVADIQKKESNLNGLTLQQKLDGLHGYLNPMYEEMEAVARHFLDSPPLQPNSGNRHRVPESMRQTFFAAMQQYPEAVQIIKFETRPTDIEPYLINTGYPITRDVCNFTGEGLLRKGPSFKVKPEHRFKPCQTDKSKGLCGKSQSWIESEARASDEKKLWSYVAVVRDGCVSSTGDYYSHRFRVLIKKCRQPMSPSNMKAPSHDEIFTFAQYWGFGFGHFLTEDLPRIAPYVEFLRKNTQIKIHAPSSSGFVKAWVSELGISPDRIIAGFHCARVLYVPEGSQCGGSDQFYTQMLSMHIRQDMPTVAPEERRNIVFIERTRSRAMQNRRAMYDSLKQLAAPHNLTIHLFSDSRLPPLHKAKEIFNAAFMIFTNHGAGEGNMILAPTGTLVFECTIYSGNANGSFHKYAVVLGHKLFTYISKDCIPIQAGTLMSHVEEYLPLRDSIVSDTCPLRAP